MANLRIDDTRRVAPGQAQGSLAAPDASRGADFASRQLQQTGQAVSQAGKLAADIWTKEAEAVNEARVNDALNRAQIAAQAGQTEWSQLRGLGALEVGENRQPVTDVYAPRFEQQVGEIANEMNLTQVQHERYAARVQPLTTRYRGALDTHFAAQSDTYLGEVANTTMAVSQMAILGNPFDEAVAGPARNDIRAAVLGERRRKGQPTEGDELAVQDVTGKAYLDAIIATEDEDFEGAQQLFDRYRDFMTPAQRNAAQNTLATGIAYNEAEAYVAAARQGTAPAPGQPGSQFQHPAPGADVSSPMGMRIHPITGARTMHGGTDFAAPLGSPARGMLGGRVLDVSYDELNGNIVRIDHGNGLIGSYAHLQGADVTEGQEITAGQNIGRVGSTGRSTGPHLHVTMRRNGELVDPETLIGESAQAAEGQAAAGRPTRAQMEADVRQRYGNNRIQREAALSAISRVFGEEAAATREQEQAAIDAAYAHIERTGTMPTAAMLAALPPGRLGAVRNYAESERDARLPGGGAPARSDESTIMALTVNPGEWENMDEYAFVAKYRNVLSRPDLISYVNHIARGRQVRIQGMQGEQAKAEVVPVEAFNRAWATTSRTLALPPVTSSDTEGMQQRTILLSGLRSWVLAKQAVEGRQLNEAEITTELNGRIARLASEPGSFMGMRMGSSGYQTSYDTMIPANRAASEAALRRAGNPNPTEAQIFAHYYNSRVVRP
jgi:murein DD-endopeptidase MepM/ murein hydrolase activator NlpD